MIRHIVCASVVLGLAALVGCSGSDGSVDDKGSTKSQLQTKKDGSATGNGTTCSWAQTTTYEVCSTADTPVPHYQLGDEFKSIDGCNECECTAKGIMCTVRTCGGGSVPPSPPDGTACTADAKKCPDGTYVGRTGPFCEFAPCGEQACDLSARICNDGNVAKPLPHSCKQVCPEDGDPTPPPEVCPAIARICKNNVPPKYATGSCKQICPEDNEPVGCTADAMQCPDGTWVGRTAPSCQFVCPDKK